MADEVDINKIIAEFGFLAVEQQLKSLTSFYKKFVTNNRSDLENGYRNYAQETFERIHKVRILSSEEHVDLADIYVPLEFSHQNSKYTESQVREEIDGLNRCLIVGTAGSGKSMFMRRHFVTRLWEAKGQIPVFFELRHLNDSGLTLFSAIQELLKKYIPNLDESYFGEIFASGRVELILDGFDEIDYDKRKKYAQQIADIARSTRKLRLVVTSRADESILSYTDFTTLRVSPFTKKQILTLIEKIDYDKKTKKQFSEAVKSTLYNKHKDLMSNPLLASIMLITFKEFAEMPPKIFIYYRRAFDALFRQHDATKEGSFNRRMHTSTPIDEFHRAFAHLCAASYAEERLSFSESELVSRFRRALAFTGINEDANAFKDDAINSVCLLIKDGLEYRFVHRSFQEYFTAAFIVEMSGSDISAAVDSISFRAATDDVLSMAHQMSPGVIEQEWVKPTLDSLYASVTGSDGYRKAISLAYESLELHRDGTANLAHSPDLDSRQFYALLRLFGLEISDAPVPSIRDIWNSLMDDTKGDKHLAGLYEIKYPKSILQEEHSPDKISSFKIVFKSARIYPNQFSDFDEMASFCIDNITLWKSRIDAAVSLRAKDVRDIFDIKE